MMIKFLKIRTRSLPIALTAGFLSCLPVYAGEADVVAAKYTKAADGTYRFDVSVRHADEGWEHYADKWQVTGPDGAVYGERVLLHPHVNEQPFTRSQSGIAIPAGVKSVILRAHDKQHGWGGAELTIVLDE
jgi:hypothetical protein